ncbi:unnamed protein product [Durusdinium trenchii]|uniref:Uncharacterized protein n=1 Tax=Durusdinium trenchii TaxID=1381693 RepID=A0ABP0IJD6_9DINO
MAATAAALAELLQEAGGEAKASVVGKLYARGAQHKAAIAACGGVRNFCRAHADRLQYIEEGAGRVRLAGYGGPKEPQLSKTDIDISEATVLEAFTAAVESAGVRNLGALKLDVEHALGVPLDAARLRCWGAASLRNLVAKAVELRDVGTRCLALSHGAVQLLEAKKRSFREDLVQIISELVEMEITITLEALHERWASSQLFSTLEIWGFSTFREAVEAWADEVGIVDMADGTFVVRGGAEVAMKVSSGTLSSPEWPEAAALILLPALRRQLHQRTTVQLPSTQLSWPLWEALLQECTACPDAACAERAVLQIAEFKHAEDAIGAHFHRLRVALALEEIANRAELRFDERERSETSFWHREVQLDLAPDGLIRVLNQGTVQVQVGDLLLVQIQQTAEFFAKVQATSPTLTLKVLQMPNSALATLASDEEGGANQRHSRSSSSRRVAALLFGVALAVPGERAVLALRGLCREVPCWSGPLCGLIRPGGSEGQLADKVLLSQPIQANEGKWSKWTKPQCEVIAAGQRQRLLLVHGPPGTGKTSTAAAMVSEWIKHHEGRALCTAESHVAAKRLVDALQGLPVMHMRWTGDVPWSELQRQLQAARVVVATCTGAGHDLLSSVGFRWLLIDEATQATEPAALIPICRSAAEQLVLLGDPQQLPPTVLSLKAIRWGLSTTLFDRLSGQQQPMLLDTQFRMHPTLCEFPAAAFYGGQLRSAAAASAASAPGRSAIEFRGVHSREQSVGSSFCNPTEADIVMSLLPELADFESILLVAPYRAQRALLERRLADLPPDHRLQVSTIDALQGGECDFLIFSATRSNPAGVVGFLSDRRRVNVLLTRARCGLIVVGDPRTLLQDPTWASWLEFAEKF